jgi:hypothetical protein
MLIPATTNESSSDIFFPCNIPIAAIPKNNGTAIHTSKTKDPDISHIAPCSEKKKQNIKHRPSPLLANGIILY